MIGETGFRVVLVSSVVAGIVAIVVSVLAEASLPFELQQYMARKSEGPLAGGDLIAFVIVAPAMVVALIAAIGMYFFWPPSRLLAVIATSLVVFGFAFSSPFVISGVAALFEDASSVLWGMALALAYWSPVAQRFEKAGTPA